MPAERAGAGVTVQVLAVRWLSSDASSSRLSGTDDGESLVGPISEQGIAVAGSRPGIIPDRQGRLSEAR